MTVWELKLPLALVLASLSGGASAQTSADLVSTTAFRVCSDAAAWPASAEDGSGYENRIAELLAQELGRPVEYVWYPMSTGFIRNTLNAAECDVIIGYAQDAEMVLNTNHYLTSSYVMVTAADGDAGRCHGTLGPEAPRGANRGRRGEPAGDPTSRGSAFFTTSSPTNSSPTGDTSRRRTRWSRTWRPVRSTWR
jgi:ABC-type amino acid transport substrate-binding protein